MCKALRDLMAEDFENEREKYAKESAEELLKMGMDYDKISLVLKYSPEEIRGWFE